MVIGKRLRALREAKKLSQADMERRTGLLRCYISRVENGHAVPVIETLEKLTPALEVPLYQLFYDGDALRERPQFLKRNKKSRVEVVNSNREERTLNQFRDLFAQMRERNRRTAAYRTRNGEASSGQGLES